MWLVANPEERPQEDFDILSHEGSTSLKGTLAIQARPNRPVSIAETSLPGRRSVVSVASRHFYCVFPRCLASV